MTALEFLDVALHPRPVPLAMGPYLNRIEGLVADWGTLLSSPADALASLQNCEMLL